MTEFINLTPHPIQIRQSADQAPTATHQPSGQVARLEETVTDDPDGTPVITYGRVVGLPDPALDTIYITSRLTAAATHRDDVRFPMHEIRDGGGSIIGAQNLARFNHPPTSDTPLVITRGHLGYSEIEGQTLEVYGPGGRGAKDLIPEALKRSYWTMSEGTSVLVIAAPTHRWADLRWIVDHLSAIADVHYDPTLSALEAAAWTTGDKND